MTRPLSTQHHMCLAWLLYPLDYFVFFLFITLRCFNDAKDQQNRLVFHTSSLHHSSVDLFAEPQKKKKRFPKRTARWLGVLAWLADDDATLRLCRCAGSSKPALQHARPPRRAHAVGGSRRPLITLCSPNFPGVQYSNTHALHAHSPTHPTQHHHHPTPTTMSLEEGTEFLFTSESVNEGHPGT